MYLTLAVTLERYVAVCHPLRARSLCTWRRARICVATVLLFAITYNLPRWWEIVTIEKYSDTFNVTIFESHMSKMRANNLYITIYINWAYLFVMYMIPFSGLVAFNLAIYRQVSEISLLFTIPQNSVRNTRPDHFLHIDTFVFLGIPYCDSILSYLSFLISDYCH